jgi:PadR family transcriptional regulator PadR
VSEEKTELLQGTLDLLILKAVTLGTNHGLGLARRIEQITQGTFQVKPGSLFLACAAHLNEHPRNKESRCRRWPDN